MDQLKERVEALIKQYQEGLIHTDWLRDSLLLLIESYAFDSAVKVREATEVPYKTWVFVPEAPLRIPEGMLRAADAVVEGLKPKT